MPAKNLTDTTLKRRKAAAASRARPPRRAESKQARIIEMLRRPAGTSVSAIMKATGWQQHSVRGFLAGCVRRKLGLTLTSEKTDGKRIYRIVAGQPGKATARSKRAAA